MSPIKSGINPDSKQNQWSLLKKDKALLIFNLSEILWWIYEKFKKYTWFKGINLKIIWIIIDL